MVEKENKAWKNLLKRHWQMFILFIIVAITAIIGAIYVFLWFVGDAQSTGLVPKILGSWTMGNLISFILNFIFWEILFIGIPLIIVFAIVYLLWWKKLPDDERKEYRKGHIFGKRSKRTDGEGAISFLIFVFSCAFQAKHDSDYFLHCLAQCPRGKRVEQFAHCV